MTRARRAVPVAALAALLVLAGALAGCGEKKEGLGPGQPQRFELMLDFFPNADHAGIYAARADHRFRDEGLDVKIRTPSDPSVPIKEVAAGRVDLAVSYEPEVLRARDQGLNVVSVGALVREPLTSIISLPAAKVGRPADLRGKRVGTAGIDYQTAYLRTILNEAHVPPGSVRERDVGFNLVPALLTKKVNAILGGFWNYEGIDLALRGKKPRVIRVQRAGVPTYDELVLVASRDALARDPGRVRRFLAGLAQGTHDLRRDPRAGVRALLRAAPDLDPRLQRASVRATLPIFLPPPGKPYGYQDPGEWAAFAAWMHDHGILRQPAKPGQALTNAYLPGRGP